MDIFWNYTIAEVEDLDVSLISIVFHPSNYYPCPIGLKTFDEPMGTSVIVWASQMLLSSALFFNFWLWFTSLLNLTCGEKYKTATLTLAWKDNHNTKANPNVEVMLLVYA